MKRTRLVSLGVLMLVAVLTGVVELRASDPWTDHVNYWNGVCELGYEGGTPEVWQPDAS